ncbi:MAG: HlyD family efflux transporter periplasmic adaptor subunit [Chloroflexi bacterium]|nr:HlyD family efflux transporter periplasmic adaptor subunit [Chloroflexota bacterium]
MKRYLIVWVTLLLVSGCTLFGSDDASTLPETDLAAAPVTDGSNVVAAAKIVPSRSATLALPVGGAVVDILVNEGATVKTGQPILRLDSRRQAIGVARAESNLRRATARLDELKAGPRQQEIEAARASVDAAQAQLIKLREGNSPQTVDSAAAAVRVAQAELNSVKAGQSAEQREMASAELANAEAVAKLRQSDYDAVKWDAGIAARPEALALEQATNNFRNAKAHYDEVMNGPSQATLDIAKAKLQQAVAQYESIKSPTRSSDITATLAEVRRTEAQLNLLLAGTRPEVIAAAAEDVNAAKTELEEAQLALSDTELRAPFGGIVVALNIKVGEQAISGAPLVQIADLTEWQFETTDLTELNVVNIQEGATVEITCDALPGILMTGKVLRIKSLGENKQGDITYAVIIQPDAQDPRLRWNMTASVVFGPKPNP